MSRMDFTKLRHAKKLKEQARERKPEKAKGAQTHIKREPVKVFTEEEKAEWLRSLGL